MKKIESFKSFSQVQTQLREEAKLKEIASKREMSTAAFNELLSKYNASSINDINEDEIEAFMTELTAEGNAFGAARAEAIAKGEDTFEVDGEEVPVKDVDAEDKENAEEFANESVVNEASSKEEAKAAKGFKAASKFMAAHPAFSNKTVTDSTVAWLFKEALKAAMIDANFHSEAPVAAKKINFAKFTAPTVFVKELGGMPIQIKRGDMMEKAIELGTEVTRAVKFDGYAIVLAFAQLFADRYSAKNSAAQGLRDLHTSMVAESIEAGDYETRINEGNAFGTARLKAIEAGEDEFEFDGKTYPVKSVDKEDKEAAEDMVDERLDNATMKRMSGLTDTRDLRDFKQAFLSIVQQHIDEGFEFDDVVEFMNSIMRDPNVKAQIKESVNEGYAERKMDDFQEFVDKAVGKQVRLTIKEHGQTSEPITGRLKEGKFGLHKIDYMGFDFASELEDIKKGDGMIMGVRPGQFLKWNIGGRRGTEFLIEVL